MKNPFTAWEWIAIIFAIVVGYVIIIIFTGIIFFNVPTTPQNEDLRKQLVEMVQNIAIGLMAITAGKILNSNKKDDVK